MEYEEEVILLKHLGRGKKANSDHRFRNHSQADKYWQKSISGSSSNKTDFTPSLENMLHTASRKTQAIFKISSYGKGEKRIAAHLSYISRSGKLELEDQEGNKISGLKAQKDMLANWSSDFGKRVDSRDTMHLVLSTPPGTDREKSYQAAKEFLQKEFKESKHDYLFVAHKDTEHPHVHAVIKMVSSLDNKLDPRKAYLNRVRQEYASICRSHGIQVEASSRAERGLPGHSVKSEFIYMRRRGKKPQADINLENKIKADKRLKNVIKHPSDEKIKKRNQLIRKRYGDKARELALKSVKAVNSGEKEKYRKEAKVLHRHTLQLSIEMEKPTSQLVNVYLNSNRNKKKSVQLEL